MLAEAENNDVYFIDQLNELRAKLPSMGGNLYWCNCPETFPGKNPGSCIQYQRCADLFNVGEGTNFEFKVKNNRSHMIQKSSA